MGRKLEFCREKALHTAMESFWAHGYEQTSMRDLAEQLGLHLGSVYNALGDKEKVFEAALKLNFEEVVLPRMKALQEAPDPLKAIDAMLNYVVDECTGVTPGPGCFLCNSLLEVAHINDSITRHVHGYLAQIETMMTSCIGNAQKAGQIRADRDPRKLAQFLMSVPFTLRTMAKLKMSPEMIRSIRDTAFAALKA
ncbi:MAG: TetR/AcrR family transcriptional regulator [Alphaproteobacteria bacterium]|nr:MAG: TetR/AcrR family transcriptional regulator [Alphaproteobacteria bacterium]